MRTLKMLLTVSIVMTFVMSCQKENKHPSCSILSPNNNETFIIGDTINIISEASDEDGTIKEIKLAINGEGKIFVTNNTLDYNWITENDTAGSYSVYIIAIDNENAETTSQVNVELVNRTEIPTLSLDSINSITDSSVKVYCQILNNGNSELIEIGVCWNTEENPTITDNYKISTNISNFYQIDIQDLEANTTYYLRGFAKNNIGIAYSVQLSFTTSEDFGTIQTGNMTDTRDNQVYNTVKISNKWWLAQNLNFYTESSLYFQNDSLTYNGYGRLYSYEDVVNSCPNGWHLASDDDWISLERAMGMPENEILLEGWRGDGIATKLKVGGESQFEAKLGGYVQNEDDFADLGLGYWWTSTKKDSVNIWFRSMSEYVETIERNAYPDNYKFSVRCVQD